MLRSSRAIVLIILVVLATQVTGCSVIDSLLAGEPEAAVTDPALAPQAAAEESETPTPATPADTSEAYVVPEAAFERVYAEQVQTQSHILDLVNGEVAGIEFGTVERDAGDALIPCDITYRSGEVLRGWVVLTVENDTWYFTAIRRDKEAPDAPLPPDADLEIIEVLTRQQTDVGYQALLRDGLATGGVTGMTLEETVMGPSTASIEVVLAGSSRFEGERAVFVLVSEGDPDDPEAWFVTKVTLVD